MSFKVPYVVNDTKVGNANLSTEQSWVRRKSDCLAFFSVTSGPQSFSI